MRLHLFILLLFTSLCFGVDFNAKTEENRAKIIEFCIDSNTNYSTFEKYNDNLWFEDEEFARELLSKARPYNLYKLLGNIKNKNILNDKALFTTIVKQCESCFRFASDTLKGDRKYVLKLIQAGYDIYSGIDNKFYADKEITLLSVKQQGSNLEYADKKLKNDKEVVWEAIQNAGAALKYVSSRFKNDKELVLVAVRKNRFVLQYASKQLKDNKEVVLEAIIKRSGDALEFASIRLRDNKEVVLEAVRKSRAALEYASEELKDDKEVVCEAMKDSPRSLQYASTRIKKDKEFVSKIMKNDILVLAYADKSILQERDIVLYYLEKLINEYTIRKYDWDSHHRIFSNTYPPHYIFSKIDPRFLDDDEIMYKAVSALGILLQYGSKRVRKNKKIVKKAVSKYGLALQYVDKELQNDKDIIILALRNNPKALQYVPHLMREDKEILEALTDKNSNAYVQNKIKRKIKPLAWESHDINETLERLYGKDRVYETSKDIDIKLPKIIYSDFDNFFKLNTNKKVKSIAILQKKEGDRALVALYYPYGNIANIRLPLKILHNYTNMDIEGIKIIAITETEDNHLFINEDTTNHEYVCMNGENPMDYHFKWLKNNLNVNIWRRKRYRIDENGIGYLKFIFSNPMLSYEEAEKLNTKVNFISHISGHIQDKKLFDLYTSEYISRNPRINLVFENMKQDEGIELFYTTIDGKVKSKYAKPRKMKKKSH